jgi:hypothetical protein
MYHPFVYNRKSKRKTEMCWGGGEREGDWRAFLRRSGPLHSHFESMVMFMRELVVE